MKRYKKYVLIFLSTIAVILILVFSLERIFDLFRVFVRNFNAFWSNNPNLLEEESIVRVRNSFFYLVEICLSILVVSFLSFFVYWLFRGEGIIVLPFENTTGDGKYSGKAISDSLISELQRIRKIHSLELRGICAEKIASVAISQVNPGSENLDQELSNLGNIGLGETSVSIDKLLVALKRVCPFSRPEGLITGSIQKYGNQVRLVANFKKSQIYSWEADRKIKSDEEIPEIIKDLAYKIAAGLSEKSISAKTWESFKYYTEALNDYYKYINTGLEKYLDQSINQAKKALDEEPGYSYLFGLFFNFGIAYMEKGDEDKAREFFNKAKSIKPTDSCAVLGSRLLESHVCEYDEALMDINLIITEDLATEAFIKDRELTPEEKCKIREALLKALEVLSKAIKLNPQVPESLAGRGAIYCKLGNYEKALEDLDKAIRLKPNHSFAFIERGLAHLKMNHCEAAIEDFNSSVRLNPNIVKEIYAERGEAYRKLGQYDLAYDDFSDAIKISPNNSLAYAQRGLAYLQDDKIDQAENDLAKALELSPCLAQTLADRCVIYLLKGKNDMAYSDIEKALSLKPKRDWYYYLKALSYKRLGNPNESKDALCKAIQISTSIRTINYQNPRNLFNLGLYHIANEEYEDAKKLYQEALSLKPHSYAIHVAHCDLKHLASIFPEYRQSLKIASIMNLLKAASVDLRLTTFQNKNYYRRHFKNFLLEIAGKLETFLAIFL
jgi:tetratricopeptide (TPR) repeat protein